MTCTQKSKKSITKDSLSDYEFLVEGVTLEDIRTFVEYMGTTSYSGNYGMQMYNKKGNIHFIVSCGTKSTRSEVLSYFKDFTPHNFNGEQDIDL